MFGYRAFGKPSPEITWFLPNGEQINATVTAEKGQMLVDACGTLMGKVSLKQTSKLYTH